MLVHPTPRTASAVLAVAAFFAALLSLFATSASAAVANPDLRPACGTRVILVLDESGSINDTAGAETAVRNAANAFASGLADSGSQLAVIEFGSSAKRVFGYTNVTGGAGGTLATTFQPYFNGTAAAPADVYNSPSQLGPWTNWQDAFEEVQALNAASGVAPLVVFITDGDPTAINLANGGVQTNVAPATALTPAVTAADAVKTQGSHILAVGVGAALNNAASLARLNAVTGPDTATTAAALNLSTTDVLAVSDFANLPAALRAIVSQLCQSSVTITKQVDSGQGFVPGGAGWQFNSTVAVSTGTYSWVTPGPATPGPRSATTGAADSAVTFQWNPTVSTVTSTFTATEVERIGFQFVDATCQVRSPANPTPRPLTITTTGSSFTASIGATDTVTCVVRNKKINPSVAITKTVNPTTVLAGTQVTYTIRVTNTGDVALNNVAVADAIAPNCARTVGNLAVGAFSEYTCTAIITQDTTNTARVTAKDPQGTAVAPKEASATVDVIAPKLAIEKTVDKPVVRAGDTVTYTITVRNTGDAPITGITVADPITPACAQPVANLAPGAFASFTCTATISVATTNVATASGKDPLGNTVTSPPSQASVRVIAPGLSITKAVNTPVVLSGTLVEWTLTVKNTGDSDLTNVTVSDPNAPGCDRVIPTLAAGATAPAITCTSTITQDTVNTASATGTDQLGKPVGPASASASVDVIAPGLAITKTVDQASVAPGTTVTYTVTVRNTGDVALTNVIVSDPSVPGCDRVVGNLAVDGTATITCTAVINAATTNVATATGTDPLGNPLPPKDAKVDVAVTPIVIVGAQQTTLRIDKTGPASATAGQVVNYRIKVTNTGAVAAQDVVVRDVIPAGMTLAAKPAGVQLVKGQVVVQIGTLAPGESKTITLKFRIDRNVGGTRVNVATASASNAPTVRDTARTRIARISGVVRVPIVTG